MSVRAKFRCDQIAGLLQSRQIDPKGPWTEENLEKVEMRTVTLSPVCSNDPQHENRTFWNATPSGSIQLGIINPEAGMYFELGAEYYIDFHKVE